MLFHRGYIQQMPVMATLDEFAKVQQQIASYQMGYLLMMGYNTDLAFKIVMLTSPCRFMMFDSSIEIRKSYNGEPTIGGITGHFEDWDYCNLTR